MNRLEKEYHYFGPWIKEVFKEEELPWQFDQCSEEILTGQMIYKIPIERERINARPGDLLYPQVLSFFDDKVVEYRIICEKIFKQEVVYKDIEYLIHSGELLRGYIEIVGLDRMIKLAFNSSSKDVTKGIVKLLRDKTMRIKSGCKLNFQHQSTYDDEVVYKYLYANEIISDKCKIGFFQQRMKLKRKVRNSILSQFSSLFGQYIQSVMILSDGEEVIVAKSERDINRKRDVDYSFKHIFIPTQSISNISLMYNEEFVDVMNISLSVGTHRISFIALEENVICNEMLGSLLNQCKSMSKEWRSYDIKL